MRTSIAILATLAAVGVSAATVERSPSLVSKGWTPKQSLICAREIVMPPTTAKRDSSASPEELPIEVPRPRLTQTTLTRRFLDVPAEV